MINKFKFHFKIRLQQIILCSLICYLFCFATCHYGFKDTAPIPQEVKTFRVNYFTNKAQYINPQLSPAITEKLKQKIINTTRLRQTNSDDAHYDISGYVAQYYTTTTGVSNNASSLNRLNVTVHLIFKNNLDDKKNLETDISSNLDYKSSLSLSEAEASLSTKIISDITDAIFNKIFSNW